MKYLIYILILGTLTSCGNNSKNKELESINRMEILGREFSNSDVRSIPNQGYIILRNEPQQEYKRNNKNVQQP